MACSLGLLFLEYAFALSIAERLLVVKGWNGDRSEGLG